MLLLTEKILSWALIISTMGMVLVVVLQIIARFALPWSPHWTEEMARFFFIYLVSIGAGLALKDHAYVNVTTFLHKFSMRGRYYVEIIILISISLLMLFMFISSFTLLKIVSLYQSPALQINMAIIYFAMTLLSFFVLFYSLLLTIEKVKNLKGQK
jgi:TRAP-type transport system small permease protein